EIVPRAGKRLEQRERDDAVVEELQPRVEPVDVREPGRFSFQHERRNLVFEARGLGRLRRQPPPPPAAERLAQRHPIDLPGDVEQVERRDRARSDIHTAIVATAPGASLIPYPSSSNPESRIAIPDRESRIGSRI